MNKAYHKITTICLLLFFLFSCGKQTSKIILNTDEGIENLTEILQNNFDENKEIYSLSISNKNRTSNEVDEIAIKFVENNKDAMWFYSLTIEKLFKPELKTENKTQSKTLKLKEFELDKILINYEKAIAMIHNETDEFNDFQIGAYAMNIDQDSNKIEHSFKIIANKKNNKPSFYGTRIDKNIFSFTFNTDRKGNLNANKDLNIF